MSVSEDRPRLRSGWVLLTAVALVAAAVGLASEHPGHCTDYTDGRRCTAFAHVLMVSSIACAALALSGVLLVTIRAINNYRRGRNQPRHSDGR